MKKEGQVCMVERGVQRDRKGPPNDLGGWGI